MNTLETKQNIKSLVIDCQRDYFYCQFEQLKIKFQQIGENQQYSLSVIDCVSNEYMDQLFKQVFQLAFNRHSILVKLKFGGCHFSMDSFTFFSSQKWQKLKNLQIFQLKMIDQYAKLLSQCYIPQLMELTLQGCEITDVGTSHICCGKWPKLQQLCLSRNRIGSNGFQAIGLSNFKDLQKLNLIENDLTDQIKNGNELFDIPNLKEIHLIGCGIQQSVLCLLDKKKQPLLELLYIYGCPVSGKELFNLKRNLGWGNLKRLWFGSSKVNQEQVYLGLHNICQFQLPNLQQIFLGFCLLILGDFKLNKKCIKTFLKSSWKYLKQLGFHNCYLQNESMKILSKCEWKQLIVFYLNSDQISDQGIDLFGSFHYQRLQQIQLRNNYVSCFGVMNLLKKFVENVLLFQQKRCIVPMVTNEMVKFTFM